MNIFQHLGNVAQLQRIKDGVGITDVISTQKVTSQLARDKKAAQIVRTLGGLHGTSTPKITSRFAKDTVAISDAIPNNH